MEEGLTRRDFLGLSGLVVGGVLVGLPDFSIDSEPETEKPGGAWDYFVNFISDNHPNVLKLGLDEFNVGDYHCDHILRDNLSFTDGQVNTTVYFSPETNKHPNSALIGTPTRMHVRTPALQTVLEPDCGRLIISNEKTEGAILGQESLENKES